MNEQRKTKMEMNQEQKRKIGCGLVEEIFIVGVTRLGEGYI
jgi:hypothetical protein